MWSVRGEEVTVNYENLRRLQQHLRESYKRDVQEGRPFGELCTRKIETLDIIYAQQSSPSAETEQRLEQMLKDYGHSHWGVFQ